jgi:PDZ domain-containing protein
VFDRSLPRPVPATPTRAKFGVVRRNEPYHRAVRRFFRTWLLAPVAAAFLLAATVYLPWYSLGPGPARAVQPLIRFEGRTRYESDGDFVLTSVRFDQLTALGVVEAWLDPDDSVVSREALFGPGETAEDERERSISEMDQSKLDAAYVVLEELTDYPEEHGEGVLIQCVVDGCAADGELYPGDLVRAIGGTRVNSVSDARRVIRAAHAGDRLLFDVTVDGDRQMVSLVREPCGGSERPLVGVSMIESFPFHIRISSGEIGGPSAGLAWALGLHDLLTPGDLTGGRTIAITGALGIDGTVLPIGGIEDKVVGAAEAGATVLILPDRNLDAARAAGRDDVELVPVATFDDALSYLQGNA